MQIIFACFSEICILIIFAVSLHLFFEEGEVFPYFLNYLSRVFCVLISPASRVQLRVQSHMPSRMESGGVLWMRHGVSRVGVAGRLWCGRGLCGHSRAPLVNPLKFPYFCKLSDMPIN